MSSDFERWMARLGGIGTAGLAGMSNAERERQREIFLQQQMPRTFGPDDLRRQQAAMSDLERAARGMPLYGMYGSAAAQQPREEPPPEYPGPLEPLPEKPRAFFAAELIPPASAILAIILAAVLFL